MKRLSILLSLLLAACPVFGGVAISDDGDCIVFPIPTLSPTTDDFTISLWVDTPSGRILGIGNSSALEYIVQIDSTGTYISYGSSSDGFLNYADIGSGWHHVVIRKDGTDYKAFIDYSTTVSNTWESTSRTADRLAVGAKYENGSCVFSGSSSVSSVDYWEYALSDDEINSLYISGLKRFALQVRPSNLELCVPLDDYADGTGTMNGFVFKDLSGNGNDGTMVDSDGDSTAVAETVLSYTP